MSQVGGLAYHHMKQGLALCFKIYGYHIDYVVRSNVPLLAGASGFAGVTGATGQTGVTGGWTLLP